MKKILRLLFQIYISVLSSIPTEIGVRLRYFAYRSFFKKTNGIFRIDSGVTIFGFDNIELGKNVNFAKNSYVYANDNGVLIIGDNFTMNNNSQLGAASGKIVIGNDCSIAPNCVLRASNHAFTNIEIPIREQGHTYGEIVVEDDVWVASNCVVTANTRIGKGSIIGAGSVVTKNVEPYSIMGGVPAKLIKKRLNT
ncbi:acyltransferase [Aliarcobacter butzleri]|uniref:acyltransferase n=1 Tax=Aliarcobacter butzleri TaxID=28197 RepID=UPI00263D7E4E|nr:acyltransferase [Aliarcobacter butzleri]MDN5098607.1 acyltransferase [Aliarcobacter butzleri]